MLITTMNTSVLKVARGLLNICTAFRAASRDFFSKLTAIGGLRFLAITLFRVCLFANRCGVSGAYNASTISDSKSSRDAARR